MIGNQDLPGSSCGNNKRLFENSEKSKTGRYCILNMFKKKDPGLLLPCLIVWVKESLQGSYSPV